MTKKKYIIDKRGTRRNTNYEKVIRWLKSHVNKVKRKAKR